ncbi:SDR family oxidoreductase [Actinocorallia sp. B10E7]|uniref:SDR family oxidoreductase n=1 Tax=Actinocorallia sp. B10E7 TaxID=3153558 RepID=UPI00325E34CB
MTDPDTLVIGATGRIGRRLVPELTRQGRHVAVLIRRAGEPTGYHPSREAEYREYVDGSGGDAERLTVLDGDLTLPGLGLPAGLDTVRDVYNLGALSGFDADREEAYRVNVGGALAAVRWTAGLPRARRLVHVGDLRVPPVDGHLGVAGTDLPGRGLDPYEADKIAADRAVREEACALGVPYNAVNPATVISDDFQGFGIGDRFRGSDLDGLVHALNSGWLRALPGDRDTRIPLVCAGHLARFLAAVPEHAAPGEAFWVLDDATPPLHDLLRLIAGHLGVRAPRWHVPAGLLHRLPRRFAEFPRIPPEVPGLLSSGRHPTGSARRLEAAAGLRMPDFDHALRSWIDRLMPPGRPPLPGPVSCLCGLHQELKT